MIRDLWKAYEVVHWVVLVYEAKAMHFPLKILKMALLAYAAPRRIRLGGSLSKEVVVSKVLRLGAQWQNCFYKYFATGLWLEWVSFLLAALCVSL